MLETPAPGERLLGWEVTVAGAEWGRGGRLLLLLWGWCGAIGELELRSGRDESGRSRWA